MPQSFNVPTFGLANTAPQEMNEQTFLEWLECIPAERRAEWIETRRMYKMSTTPNPTPEKITADELRRAFDQINARIDALTETLNVIMQGISHAATATPPAQASKITTMTATAICRSIDDNGKTAYKMRGVEYPKNGIRIWDEVLTGMGYNPADIAPGVTTLPAPMQVQILWHDYFDPKTKETRPTPYKVIGKA